MWKVCSRCWLLWSLNSTELRVKERSWWALRGKEPWEATPTRSRVSGVLTMELSCLVVAPLYLFLLSPPLKNESWFVFVFGLLLTLQTTTTPRLHSTFYDPQFQHPLFENIQSNSKFPRRNVKISKEYPLASKSCTQCSQAPPCFVSFPQGFLWVSLKKLLYSTRFYSDSEGLQLEPVKFKFSINLCEQYFM